MKNLIKLIALFIVFILTTAICNSQTQDTIIENCQIEKMIQESLLTVLKIEKYYREKGYSRSKMSDDYNIWVDYYPAGFEPDPEIYDLNLKIKYISIYGLTKNQKKKGINGLVFSGVRIDGNKIILNFTSQGVFLKDKNLYVGKDAEGYSFKYEYSCEKQEWVLIEMPQQYEFIK